MSLGGALGGRGGATARTVSAWVDASSEIGGSVAITAARTELKPGVVVRTAWIAFPAIETVAAPMRIFQKNRRARWS